MASELRETGPTDDDDNDDYDGCLIHLPKDKYLRNIILT